MPQAGNRGSGLPGLLLIDAQEDGIGVEPQVFVGLVGSVCAHQIVQERVPLGIGFVFHSQSQIGAPESEVHVLFGLIQFELHADPTIRVGFLAFGGESFDHRGGFVGIFPVAARPLTSPAIRSI